MDWSNILEAIGGVFVAIYAIWTILLKVSGEIGLVSKRQKDRKNAQKEAEAEKHKQIVESVSDALMPKITEELGKLDEKIDKITISSNDMLRFQINEIYYRYNHYKKILRYDRENCSKLVQDYFRQGGNSYVHTLWDEIQEWEVADSWEEIKKGK